MQCLLITDAEARIREKVMDVRSSGSDSAVHPFAHGVQFLSKDSCLLGTKIARSKYKSAQLYTSVILNYRTATRSRAGCAMLPLTPPNNIKKVTPSK